LRRCATGLRLRRTSSISASASTSARCSSCRVSPRSAWDTTLALFRDEYRVPLLSPAVAAVLGAFGELVFPIFLVLGLGTRAAALGLSFVNAMAVVSYWHVLSTLEPALAQHVFWGTLLLVPLTYGPRRFALDRWLAPRLGFDRAQPPG